MIIWSFGVAAIDDNGFGNGTRKPAWNASVIITSFGTFVLKSVSSSLQRIRGLVWDKWLYADFKIEKKSIIFYESHYLNWRVL